MQKQTREEEWTLFLENLIACAVQQCAETPQGEIHTQCQQQLDAFLAAHLTVENKKALEKILCARDMAADAQMDAVYRQGLRDCAWLLKQLHVLGAV